SPNTMSSAYSFQILSAIILSFRNTGALCLCLFFFFKQKTAYEIGKNFTALNFTYFDSSGNVVAPTSLANRISIARVDVQLTVQTSGRLSTGRQPTHSLRLRTIPRNLQLRSAN